MDPEYEDYTYDEEEQPNLHVTQPFIPSSFQLKTTPSPPKITWKVASKNFPKFILGMISHKMSLITIFGYKHFRQKFHQNF